ncbi:MAG: SRPBCC family protein [Anaerolineae bacterium]|nr:SRPBCC family protein [Anaerolineae bacterium]
MPLVEQSIDIEAPVQAVFGMIADQPERQPEWWPPIELQERVSPPPTGLGSVSRYVYNMMGVKIKGEHEVVEMRPNEYLRVKTTSGIDSAFEFIFQPQGRGTHLTIRVDYKLPGSVIGQLLNKLVIEQKNESDLRDGLANLKAILEREAHS